jgi:hypothetical protein
LSVVQLLFSIADMPYFAKKRDPYSTNVVQLKKRKLMGPMVAGQGLSSSGGRS